MVEVGVCMEGTVDGRQLGNFSFLQLPSQGDQVRIGAASGAIELFEVLFVEHRPVSATVPPRGRPKPDAIVVVRYLREAET